MRLLLRAAPAVALLASLAQAQVEMYESISPLAGFPTDPATVVASQLPPAPVLGSDSCATAEVLGNMVGSIGFDLTAATTGTEGQTSFTGGDCNYGCAEYGTGNVQVPGDVWFLWTAPSTGRVRISSCPAQTDTKIAVYDGPVCPTGTACIACNDDYHGSGGTTAYLRDSILYFDATGGANYLIQVGRGFGLFAGAGFVGAFTIEVAPITRPDTLDDGTGIVGFSFGTTVGFGNCRMQRFGNVGSTVTVTGANISWGWLNQTGLVNGTPCTVAIWKDVNDDGNPVDGLLLQQVATTMQNVATDTFVTVPFSPPLTITGAYFIGVASQLQSTTERPLTADNGLCDIQPDAAWYGVNTAGAYDVTNIPANTTPATRFGVNCQAQGTASYNGLYHLAWTIRSNVLVGPPPIGVAECLGDGTGAACPCGNSGGAGRGCENSATLGGARLTGVGVASISADSVVLTCDGMTGPGLFFQANALVGTPIAFNDGLLCAAVGILRLGVVFPTGGTAIYPGGLTPNPITVGGAPILAGDFKHYQCWYRDITVGFCSVSGHNMSSGLGITWAP